MGQIESEKNKKKNLGKKKSKEINVLIVIFEVFILVFNIDSFLFS